LKEMERDAPTSESRFYRDLFGYLVLRDDVARIFLSRKAEGNLPLDVYSAIYSISISRNADLVIRSKERVMSFLRENLGLMKALPDQLGEYVVVRVARGEGSLEVAERYALTLLKEGFKEAVERWLPLPLKHRDNLVIADAARKPKFHVIDLDELRVSREYTLGALINKVLMRENPKMEWKYRVEDLPEILSERALKRLAEMAPALSLLF